MHKILCHGPEKPKNEHRIVLLPIGAHPHRSVCLDIHIFWLLGEAKCTKISTYWLSPHYFLALIIMDTMWITVAVVRFGGRRDAVFLSALVFRAAL